MAAVQNFDAPALEGQVEVLIRIQKVSRSQVDIPLWDAGVDVGGIDLHFDKRVTGILPEFSSKCH